MADILIKGLVLPKEGHIEAHIWCNGTVTYRKKIDNQWDKNSTTAIELPEHGDLADKIDIIHLIEKIADADLAQDIIGDILALPTIVEANYGTDN